ncbi:MAG: hypothetical protein IBJ11_10235 [Phycisphaerales bacterium]|nr:hypothetical protein [Phycisphaerales bacterium]
MSVIALSVFSAGAARAGMIDLTQAGTSVNIGGALWETTDYRTAGTGNIRPFLRVQANNTEQGYNTSARPTAFDEKGTLNYTHDVQIQDLGGRVVNGVPYYEILLDINENNNNQDRYLSLDQLKIFISPMGGQNTANIASLGTLVYDIDAATDNWLAMDFNLNAGSGQGDVRFLLPVSVLSGFSPTSYFILFSRFGDNMSSDDGVEEWSLTDQIVVPTPGTAVVLLAAGVVARRRRRG